MSEVNACSIHVLEEKSFAFSKFIHIFAKFNICMYIEIQRISSLYPYQHLYQWKIYRGLMITRGLEGV